MRIIAGRLRGRNIQAPAGLETRPTADRVKETMFNLIQGRIRDANCLDLFAGSGNLGLEALSRYAATCTFVEKDPSALGNLEKNIESLGLQPNAIILGTDIYKALSSFVAKQFQFDIIFADPPYDFPTFHKVVGKIAAHSLLAKDGALVWEHDAKKNLQKYHDLGMEIELQRKVGRAMITVFDSKNDYGKAII